MINRCSQEENLRDEVRYRTCRDIRIWDIVKRRFVLRNTYPLLIGRRSPMR